MRYEVTTVDLTVQGFERLRSPSEFILNAYPSKSDDPAAIVQTLKDDIQSCARPDDFDYDAARSALDEWFDDSGIAHLRSQLNAMEEPDEDEGDDEGNPVVLFVYVRDTEAE